MSKRKHLLALSVFLAMVAICFVIFQITNLRENTPKEDIAIAKSAPATRETTVQRDDVKQLETLQTLPVELSLRQEDTEIEKLSDDFSEEVSRKAVSLIDNPIPPGRAKLLKKMANETTEETFLHLVDHENFAMLIPSMGSYPLSFGYYPSDVRTVSKMTRVRKLVEESRGCWAGSKPLGYTFDR